MSGSESKQPTLLDKPGEKRSEVKVPPRPEVTVTRKQEPQVEEKREQEVFAIMEKRDEDQITKQLQGELVQEYFYSFKQGNREIVGLSWVGVKECARYMGSIKLDLVQLTEKDDEYQVVIKATDMMRNLDALGVSTQRKIDKYTGKPDDFSLQKAMSKAQRNAIRSLLPEKTIATMLKKFKEGKLK